MATRFRRSVKLLPGIRLDIAKKDLSLNVGDRGATMTFGRDGSCTLKGVSEIGLPFRNKLGGLGGNSSVGNLENKVRLYNEAANRAINIYRYTPTQPATLDEFGQMFFDKKEKPFTFKMMIGMAILVVGAISLIRDFDSVGLGVLLLLAVPYIPIWHIHRGYKVRKWNEEYAQKIYQGVEAENAKAIEHALGKALDQMDWLCEVTASFEVSEDAKQVFIDVNLPEIEDMPNCVKKIAETYESIENIPKKKEEIQQDYLTHVHGLLIRMAGFCFSFFPSVEKVLCSGYTQQENEQTNMTQDDYVLSVWFERSKWEKASSEQDNPINYVESFQYCRNLQNGLFEAVEPFSAP